MAPPSKKDLNTLEVNLTKRLLASASKDDLTLLNYRQPCAIRSNTLKIDKEPNQLNNKKN